jgi:diguanylate cyclase (GGDEF)-like protein
MTNKRKVLVVDASKVVRASLTKQLSGRFEIREEASDESAWQTMVLDGSIVAVVSGLPLARVDGLGLLERLRANKLSRLKNVPFFLVVSNSVSEDERQAARQCGVTEFIVKGSTSPSVESIVSSHMEWREDPAEGRVQVLPVAADEDIEPFGNQSDIGVSNIMGLITRLEPSASDMPEEGYGNEDAILAQEMLEEYLSRRLPEALEGQGVGVLAFGLDGYEDLVARYGYELAFRSAQKFCGLLSRKIRTEDFIGQLANGRVVIVTPSTTAATCVGFANRICKAMASAQISLRGERINLTVSVGVAVVPDDGAELSEQDLLQLAYQRLDAAVSAGGNRVMASAGCPASCAGNCESFLPRLKEILAATDPAALRPCLGTIGMQLMPILRELDKSFRFGLPLEEMNKRLWDRARAERMIT